METGWSEEVPVGIIACDADGIIEWMNDRAARIFKSSGGMELVGSGLMDCHPEEVREKVRELFQKKRSHCYTLEKEGARVMLYQAPRFDEGVFRGFVEFIFTLPTERGSRGEAREAKA